MIGGGAALVVLVVFARHWLRTASASGDHPPFRVARSERRYVNDLVPVLDVIAGSLRSGSSLLQAVAEAEPVAGDRVGPDLDAIVRGATSSGLVTALDAWAVRRPFADVRLVAAALALALETGGAAARAVDGVGSTLRQRAALRDEMRALTTQARLSAAVITAAPVAFGGLMTLGGRGTLSFFLRSRTGVACLVGGLGLDLVGAAWMVRLSRSVAA